MTHRFCLDNDGTNFFSHTMTDDVEGSIADAVDACPGAVTTYFLCPNRWGKFLFPTTIGEVDSTPDRLQNLHAAGIDPFGMFLQALRAAGKETFITFRINDAPAAVDSPHIGRFSANHPEYMVDQTTASAAGDAMALCLDLSHEEVRDYLLSILVELVARYDLDGLQLDWMRYPRHLSGPPNEVWEKRVHLTDFMTSVRQIVGQDLKVSARVPSSSDGCRYLGIDLGAWARGGLVDMLVASPFLTTEFQMPIGGLRSVLRDRSVPIYADIEFDHGNQIHCQESLRAAALGLLSSGADGIYIFNFPCWTEYMATPPYHWLPELASSSSAPTAGPLLFSVSQQVNRLPDVDPPGQLPARLPVGDRCESTLVLPRQALPARRALFIVDGGGDFTVTVNGHPTLEISVLRRAEIFVEYALQTDQGTSLRSLNSDCRIFRCNPDHLRPGENVISLFSTSPHDLEITRINLGIW
jgi:hypothetical protein